MQTASEQLTQSIGESGSATSARAQQLAALTNRLGSRHGYTSDHTTAVSLLAGAIGRRLGLGTEDLAVVKLGALLHDVGKLEVPETILSKPAALDELEWRAMRRHVESGERESHLSQGYWRWT